MVPGVPGTDRALSLEALVADEELRRHEFPVARRGAHFAHAAVAPLPRRVAAAVLAYVERAMTEGQFEPLHSAIEAEARALAAELIRAHPDEVAFASSTSAGLGLVAAGLDWAPGDRVVIFEGDFPANARPWLALERQGVAIDAIPRNAAGLVTIDDVAARVGPRTRLVALSTVNYLTGASIDVAAIGRFLRSRGTLFCLDAIQSLGVLPCSVEHCDFLVADAHKWLLGPQGIAILYVRREAQDRLRPALQGWKSVRDPRDFQLLRQELAPTARRYEPGGLNVLGVIGLHAALALGRDVGGDAIARRVTSVRTRLVRAIEDRGHEVLGPRDGPASIATFAPPPDEVDRILRRLEARRVVVSVRRGARGERRIRVAPHFYASEAEVASFLEALG